MPPTDKVSRESVDDVLEIVGTYGPWGPDINESLRFQIVLAEEVQALRGMKANLSLQSIVEWASSWVPESNRARFADALKLELAVLAPSAARCAKCGGSGTVPCRGCDGKREFGSSASPLISAKERKPTGDVLLLTTSRMWIIGDWYKGTWRTHRSFWDPGDVDGAPMLRSAFAENDITHWTPLPDPDSLAASATSPTFVWAVESKTTFALFASEDLAKTYVSSFPPSISGGMGVAKLAVLRAKTEGRGASG